MRYGKRDVAGRQTEFIKQTKAENGKEKKLTCPIIYTFGSATDAANSGQDQEQGRSVNQAGTVSIGDAHILFFPVNSMAGPLWMSTSEKVIEAWGQTSVTLPQNTGSPDDTVVTSLDWNKELNLGWLMFTATKGLEITPPETVKSRLEWQSIKERIVLVSPKLFSQIVNSNLEVRTSVSIDPATGAAEPGALFTYEAIPRSTWLWCDVVEDDYRRNDDGTSNFPRTDKKCQIEKIQGNGKSEEKKTYIDNKGEPLGEIWSRPLDVVKAGLILIEYLGVGGMGTRGFGRMRALAEWEASNGDVS